MKHLLIALCLVASFAQAQVSQRYAARIYRVGDQLVIADSLGSNQTIYPFTVAQIVATNSLVRVNISGLSKYYQPAKILNSSGVAYSTTSTTATVAGILATVPDGTIPTSASQVGAVALADYNNNKTATDLALTKIARVIRVDSYGGSTKAAIESAISAAQVGDEIILPTGNLNIAGQINVNKRVKIRRGEGITRLYETTPYTTLFHVTADSVSFDGLIITQTGTGDESNWPTSYGSGITFFRVTGGFVTNCIIRNAGDAVNPNVNSTNGALKSGAAIYATGSSYLDIRKNKFFNSISGVNNDDFQNVNIGDPARFFCNDVRVIDNYFENCFRPLDWDFLGLGGGADFIPGQITGNYIIMKITPVSGATGIKLTMPLTVSKLIIRGNTIKGKYQDGIGVLKGCQYVHIDQNTIDGPGNGVTYFTSAGFQVVKQQTLTGNTIINCTNSGVIVSASYDLDISNNEISNNRRGVWISNNSFNISLSNNKIHDNAYTGIQADNVYGLTVSGGYIVNNGTDLTNGYRTGILFNQPNVAGSISGVLISGVHFDYTYNDATAGASISNQTNAIKTVGTYWSSNGNNRAGTITNNYFGRGAIVESMLESVGGFSYRLNPTGASTGDFLVPPTVTQTQRLAISTPTNGQTVFQTDGTYGIWTYLLSKGGWARVLTSRGGINMDWRTTAITYNVATTDHYITADATAGAISINLPSTTTTAVGFELEIMRINSGSNNVTVSCFGGQSINGLSTYILDAQYKSAKFVSDGGSAWYVFAK